MAGISPKAHVIGLLAQKLTAASAKHVYSPSELHDIFDQLRSEWSLPKGFTRTKFRNLALESNTLQEVRLTATYPLHTTRYHWGTFSPYELALSLRPDSYLSHGTAAFLHGFLDNQPEFIYVNKEQSAKDQSGALTQAALKRAFSGKQRQSGFIVSHEQTRIMLLNGKDTNHHAVERITGDHGETIELTNPERTLIDITVRPAYAGGIRHVLNSYRQAVRKISVDHLAETLKELDYLYPYHQAIGFLLERAGYNPASLAVLRGFELKHDFFLAHGMKKTKFDPRWRIYYPEDLPAA